MVRSRLGQRRKAQRYHECADISLVVCRILKIRDRMDKRFERALDYNPATDRAGCGTEFYPNETVEFAAAPLKR